MTKDGTLSATSRGKTGTMAVVDKSDDLPQPHVPKGLPPLWNPLEGGRHKIVLTPVGMRRGTIESHGQLVQTL